MIPTRRPRGSIAGCSKPPNGRVQFGVFLTGATDPTPFGSVREFNCLKVPFEEIVQEES
jgi:hypothetical protein